MRLGDGSSVECAFHATEEPSPCRSPEQSSIFSSLFVPGAPGVAVNMNLSPNLNGEVNRCIKNSSKYFYIHPLFYFVLIVAIFTQNLKKVAILYMIAVIHELFHLIIARNFKIKIECVKVMPFGITLKIKDNYIPKPEHEIIVAIAGPFSNALMMFIAFFVKIYYLLDTDDITFFIFANIVIGVINLIPVLPLDGGRILKAILTIQWGFIKAFNFTLKVTKIISFFLFILGIYMLYLTRFNFSLLLIAAFLIFNIANERQNNNLMVMKEIVYYKEKLLKEGIFKAKNIVVIYNLPAQKLLKNFSYNHFHLVTVIDSKMNIIGTLTEAQIIEGLVDLGCEVKVEEILLNNRL
jgi:stage IV sporulation protein FB